MIVTDQIVLEGYSDKMSATPEDDDVSMEGYVVEKEPTLTPGGILQYQPLQFSVPQTFVDNLKTRLRHPTDVHDLTEDVIARLQNERDVIAKIATDCDAISAAHRQEIHILKLQMEQTLQEQRIRTGCTALKAYVAKEELDKDIYRIWKASRRLVNIRSVLERLARHLREEEERYKKYKASLAVSQPESVPSLSPSHSLGPLPLSSPIVPTTPTIQASGKAEGEQNPPVNSKTNGKKGGQPVRGLKYSIHAIGPGLKGSSWNHKKGETLH